MSALFPKERTPFGDRGREAPQDCKIATAPLEGLGAGEAPPAFCTLGVSNRLRDRGFLLVAGVVGEHVDAQLSLFPGHVPQTSSSLSHGHDDQIYDQISHGIDLDCSQCNTCQAHLHEVSLPRRVHAARRSARWP